MSLTISHKYPNLLCFFFYYSWVPNKRGGLNFGKFRNEKVRKDSEKRQYFRILYWKERKKIVWKEEKRRENLRYNNGQNIYYKKIFWILSEIFCPKFTEICPKVFSPKFIRRNFSKLMYIKLFGFAFYRQSKYNDKFNKKNVMEPIPTIFHLKWK